MDIFLSYSSKEMHVADYICDKLEISGLECWMAHRDIPYGSDYAEEIPGAITNCRVFLLLISENALKSKYVLRELDDAVEKEKFVIPFYIRKTKLDDRFQFFLKRYQHIEGFISHSNPSAPSGFMHLRNAVDLDDDAINQLIIRIKNLLGYPIEEPVIQPPEPVLPIPPAEEAEKNERQAKRRMQIVCPKCESGTLKKIKYYPEKFANWLNTYTTRFVSILTGYVSTLLFLILYAVIDSRGSAASQTETPPITETSPATEETILTTLLNIVKFLGTLLYVVLPYIFVGAIISVAIYILLQMYKKHFLMIKKSKMRIWSFQCCSCMRKFSIMVKHTDNPDERVPNLVEEHRPRIRITRI